MWMLNDRPRDGGRGLHFVNKVVILLGKSMSVAHLLEVYFGEGGSCCFVIGSKGVQWCQTGSNRGPTGSNGVHRGPMGQTRSNGVKRGQAQG